MSDSHAFGRLHPMMQRWVWQQGWSQLRDVQERAVAPILDGNQDVIIAAATASGKTEAALLPLLTKLLEAPVSPPAHLICISPLKALINDQHTRIEDMCLQPELPVVAWHGEANLTKKQRFLASPRGVILITPESLEAMLDTRGIDILRNVFRGTTAVLIDELHAFIGEERGKQLQSLLRRIEAIAGRSIQRVGLSATLGDMLMAAEFLRPNSPVPAHIVVSDDRGSGLKVQVRGYECRLPIVDEETVKEREQAGKPVTLEDVVTGNVLDIAKDLYRTLRGHNNLVFPNNRRSVEVYSDLLRRMCERDERPNEFWPHHGSLAKDVRADAEAALKDKARPATAIATTTLELGIDVGSVRSVAQVEKPHSVASLRQRLGRSGRREGESAILRAYCSELPLEVAEDPCDRLRENLFQTTAMVNLLLNRWCEPPLAQGMHLSTLVQQLLALIAERHGVKPAFAYQLLVETGPFHGLSKAEFATLLRHLGEKKLLIQDTQGALHHGEIAERAVNHFEFYAAFASKDEFRLQVVGGKNLGSLPLERPVVIGDHLVFGGRRWRVQEVELAKKLITVLPASGARPPQFDGSGMAPVHEQVRREMRRLYTTQEPVAFQDKTAAVLFEEGRANYGWLGLASRDLVPYGTGSLLFTWKGDLLDSALALMLTAAGLPAHSRGLCIEIQGDTRQALEALQNIAIAPQPDVQTLVFLVENRELEKWDWALPEELLNKGYASLWLDIDGAYKWCLEYTAP